jgi:hypothetical protein
MNVVTKFSYGDTAYYIGYAQMTIYAVIIQKVYLRNNQIYYDVLRKDTEFIISGVQESEIDTFPVMKTTLLTYLQNKLTEITAMVAP